MARSKELEEKAIELYNSGLSMAAVGKEIGRSAATVLAILNKYNIPKRTNGGIYKLPEQEIIDKYLNDKRTMDSIANDYNVTLGTIKKILLDNNIVLRTASETRNPYFKKDAFKNIDNEAAAYYLGLFITDGCILEPDLNNNHPNYKMQIELQSNDDYILEELKKWLQLSSTNLYKAKRLKGNIISETSTLGWYSTEMAQDFAQYGVVPRKTDKVYLPIISPKFMPHLLRGLIDGDGCISINSQTNKLMISFCGNQTCVTQVRDFISKELFIKQVKVLQIGPHLWQISYGSQSDCYKICDYIYKDANYYLKRKKNKFLQIFPNYENTEVN